MTDITHDTPEEGAPARPAPQEIKAAGADTLPQAEAKSQAEAYWRANLSLLGKLLAVWFTVSFGFGIVLRDVLDQIVIGGYPLGFWFAQQGSIFVFVALIFVYSAAMRRIDKRFGVED